MKSKNKTRFFLGKNKLIDYRKKRKKKQKQQIKLISGSKVTASRYGSKKLRALKKKRVLIFHSEGKINQKIKSILLKNRLVIKK